MRAFHPLICIPILLAGCATSVGKARPQQGEAERAAKVSIAGVAVRPMPRYLALTGTLAANRASQVAADGVGRVQQTFVERGQLVRAGDLLVQLDARSARLSHSEARAQVQALRSQEDAARRECARSQKLLEGSVIGQAEHDRMSAQCTASEWSSEAAAARAELANKALGDAAVRAPFSGMVVERFVSVGEYVRAGTAIASLVEMDPLRLQLTVPESEIARVRAGQDVSFEVTAFEGERFAGKVVRLSPAVRPGSRDLIVEAEVANPGGKLLPGMFALARIALERAQKPVVPSSALRGEGTQSRVFAVVDGRLEERLVQLGEREGELVAIEKGVVAGELVASNAAEALQDGLRVR
jgi:membrane fusion protein (multidrug efflux system)